MSLLAERAGGVHIRVGGNTQEFAYVVDSLPDGKMMEKDKAYLKNPVRLVNAVAPFDSLLTSVDAMKDWHSYACPHERLLLHA